jgi:hypothetical protein
MYSHEVLVRPMLLYIKTKDRFSDCTGQNYLINPVSSHSSD